MAPHSRGAVRARALPAITLSKIKEGAGNAGCWLHPWPPREKSARGVDHRFSRDDPAFPAQWFYGLLRALPGEPGVVVTVVREVRSRIFAKLSASHGAPGPRGFAVRAGAARPSAPTRPPHPALNVRDDAYAPQRGGTDAVIIDFGKKESEIFLRQYLERLDELDSAKRISIYAQENSRPKAASRRGANLTASQAALSPYPEELAQQASRRIRPVSGPHGSRRRFRASSP